MVSDAQKRGSERYKKRRSLIHLTLKAEDSAQIKAAADAAETSITQFMLEAALGRINCMPAPVVTISNLEKIAKLSAEATKAREDLILAKEVYESALNVYLAKAAQIEQVLKGDNNGND